MLKRFKVPSLWIGVALAIAEAGGNVWADPGPPAAPTLNKVQQKLTMSMAPQAELFGGTSAPGTTLTVSVDGGPPVCTATAGPDGKWTCPPSIRLPVGAYTISVTAKDSTTGLTSLAYKQQVTPHAEVFGGTSVPGTTLTVSADGGPPVCTATAGHDGKWICSPSIRPPPDTISVTAKDPTTGLTSLAYNQQVAPQAEVFGGTSAPGTIVTVSVDGGPPVCTATADQDGQWTCPPPISLSVGTHTISVTAKDPTTGLTSAAHDQQVVWALAFAEAPAPPPAPPAATPATQGKFSLDFANFEIGAAPAQGATPSQVSVAVTYRSDPNLFKNWLVGGTLNVPTTSVGADADSEIDQFTTSWRVGLTLGKEWTLDSDGNELLRLELLPQFGFQQFVYYPQGGSASSTDWHFSWDGSADLIYVHIPNTGGIPNGSGPVALEATYGVAYDWMASPAAGIVAPGSSMVTTRVVSDATVQPSMTGRLFLFKAFGGHPFAIGPSIAMSSTGPQGHGYELGQTAAVRGEFWVYFMPSNATPVDLRIGIAPYLTWYFEGADPEGRNFVPGALFQVRVSSPSKGTPSVLVFAY